VSARITIDLDHVHPVTDDNVAHRPKHLLVLPQVGDQIWFLCGLRDTVAFAQYDPNAVILTCWPCDLAYRLRQNLPILPEHPGLPKNRHPRGDS
jgi:hypothetical protein